jgi:hypothetical protein
MIIIPGLHVTSKMSFTFPKRCEVPPFILNMTLYKAMNPPMVVTMGINFLAILKASNRRHTIIVPNNVRNGRRIMGRLLIFALHLSFS